jgi:hypothetical protein
MRPTKRRQARVNNNPSRRRPIDRRKRTLRALIHGSFTPRRHGSRREGDQSLTAVDWHHPQWLAVALLTLLMSFADALLTLTLLQRGAYEANPFMAPLVHGAPLAFAIIKIGLTGGGIIVLTLLARARIFGSLRVSFILYAVLFAYAALVGYEFWMLQTLLDATADPI